MNVNVKVICCYLFLPLFLGGFSDATAQKKLHYKTNKDILKVVDSSLNFAASQYKFLQENVPVNKFPRTFENGRFLTTEPEGWVSGFYPGSLLYLFEYTKDSSLLKEAKIKLQQLEPLKNATNTHDLGFMMYCSFGNAYRLFKNEHHKQVLIQSAKSLASRFNAKVGCIKSWDQVKSLDGKRTLTYPVIIDNMMNLELLFFASKFTGNPYFKNIAIAHAETTLKNHFRSDFSSYHVVNYDAETGAVKSKETHQGFSDNSTWSRGQAWAIYGYTLVYRETGDKKYLKAVQRMADFYLNHSNLPEDKIPYWDFNVNQSGFNPLWKYDPNTYPIIPRDASAAAIVASALIELAEYVDRKSSQKYLEAAEQMLKSLSSAEYTAALKANGGFILLHGSGSLPRNSEVDVPLSYADYYYIEALMRYRLIDERSFSLTKPMAQ